MFEKMIGVSPPQVGKGEGSKVANVKDFKETAESKSAYKNDFEKALKEKQLKADHKAEPERKLNVAKKDEPKALKKDKKSSGGIKKKMTDVDDKMVSNNMASKESVVEAPVAKETAPAMIKTDNTIKEVNPEAQAAQNAALAMTPASEAVEAVDAKTVDLQGPLQKLSIDPSLEAQLAKAQAAVPEANVSPEALQAAQQSQQQQPELSVEAQLGAAVGLTPEAETKKPAKDLQKLNEAPVKSNAPSTFEKNVLETLQKESSLNSGSEQSSQKEQSGFDQKDKGDLKSDLSGNQLHQSAGQSHSSFKTHLEAGAAASTSSQMDASQLEARREDNVNEIMKEAQYLVKKGGGEVTVKMSPEGMGEVQLKVVLENGKLNVEMQTQDRDVKRLIEESLSELKSGLAAHRLSLEHVKIDTVNATNADNSAQLQSNLNQHSEGRRDLWQESFQQSQQQLNQQTRQRLSADSSRATGSIGAVSTPRSSQAQALRTYGGTKGASLNRVA
jgi:flagellar hook-length control protein FliK